MKIAVACESILLQKALEQFLQHYLTSKKQCDLIVSDKRIDVPNLFYIANEEGADLLKPFSKSQLLLALENRYKELGKKEPKERSEDTLSKQNANFEILEKRIEMLTKEYQKNIIEAIKAFYG